MDSIPTDCSQMPRGGDGSLSFQETIRDHFVANGIGKDDGATVPHEIGHQLGLDGDKPGQKLMSGDSGVEQTFIPDHLHIIRCMVKSPGQP